MLHSFTTHSARSGHHLVLAQGPGNMMRINLSFRRPIVRMFRLKGDILLSWRAKRSVRTRRSSRSSNIKAMSLHMGKRECTITLCHWTRTKLVRYTARIHSSLTSFSEANTGQRRLLLLVEDGSESAVFRLMWIQLSDEAVIWVHLGDEYLQS